MSKAWTGERLETFIFNETAVEHLHRYAIATKIAMHKKVLDVACGEGYGANLLAETAASIDGVDNSTEIIKRAKDKYKKQNLQFSVADVSRLPFPENQFDVVVSFETLEHVQDHDKMLGEIKRVLHQDGILIISTPDKRFYNDATGFINPHHVHELYEDELRGLLSSLFKNIRFFYQRSAFGSVMLNENNSEPMEVYEGDFKKINRLVDFHQPYLVAIASDADLPEIPTSLFLGDAMMETALREQALAFKKLASYRLGHFLLYPFKKIRGIFKKNQ
jgi:ubiquinone/menaquinone biosynthesis C-methylase UbiE